MYHRFIRGQTSPPRWLDGFFLSPMLLGIRLYRRVFSPDHGVLASKGRVVCRFWPSCSEYAEGALRRHGVWKGLLLTIKRIMRCHPWHKGGYDPVP